ncbi:MAG TPA: MarC family protein [Methyloceanibacter sp.]|nr:MarC family protein [Methyloceanibacter sp.]
MDSVLNIFLLELAALFPVVNPPGSALVFLGMTGNVTHEVRRLIAWRVARNAFFVLVGSLSPGALILRFYGISIPVLRVAGGIIVAVAGWKLLTEGSQKELEASTDGRRPANPLDQAFYPLTLPLTTGPGTIAVVISLGLSRGSYTSSTSEADCRRHFCVFRVRGPRPAPVGAGRHQYRRAALGLHPILPRNPDSLVRRKRVVAVRDAHPAPPVPPT